MKTSRTMLKILNGNNVRKTILESFDYRDSNKFADDEYYEKEFERECYNKAVVAQLERNIDRLGELYGTLLSDLNNVNDQLESCEWQLSNDDIEFFRTYGEVDDRSWAKLTIDFSAIDKSLAKDCERIVYNWSTEHAKELGIKIPDHRKYANFPIEFIVENDFNNEDDFDDDIFLDCIAIPLGRA